MLQAHTNEQGSHSKISSVYPRSWGFTTFQGRGDFDYRSGHTYVSDVSFKDFTQKGNHRDPTSYRRVISRVVSNEPAVTHKYLATPYWVLDDYRDERYLSESYNVVGDPYTGLFIAHEENARDRSAVECMNRLSSMKAELGVDLLEARKSVDMLAGAAIDLVSFLRQFRRGLSVEQIFDWGKGNITSKSVANKWLEFSYGWSPLAGSVHDLAQIAHRDLKKDLILSSKRTIQWGELTKEEIIRNRVKRTIRARGTVRTHIQASVSIPWLQTSSNLGLVNPASLLWETLPYSFVLDWFVPVGNLLSAVSDRLGLSYNWGYTGYRQFLSFDQEWLPDAFYERLEKNAVYRSQHQEFHRRAFTSWPALGLYAVENPFSITRAANAAALIRGLWK